MCIRDSTCSAPPSCFSSSWRRFGGGAMFEQYSYLGYTLLFCVPPIVLLWVRAEFARAMREDLRGILLSTAIISLYGSAIWPVAIRLGCWSYREDRILN